MLHQLRRTQLYFAASNDTAAASRWNSSLAKEFPPAKEKELIWGWGQVMGLLLAGGGFAGFNSATNKPFHCRLFNKLLTAKSERRRRLLPSTFFFF
jgi:hypothetical protein